MELHYFWANNFGFLKRRGVNLSAKFIIDLFMPLEGSPKGSLPTLSIEPNPDYIEKFFQQKNVTNVTAIIGQNGSGKSTILKYITAHLPEGLEANLNSDILVYSVVEDEVAKYHILVPETLEIAVDDKTGLFEKFNYGQGPLVETFRFTGHLSNADYIYYSFFLDYHTDTTDWGGLRDISTARLLADEHNRFFRENGFQDVPREVIGEASDLQRFYLTEVAKAIQFFNSPESKHLPFDKPEELFIDINDSDWYYFDNDKTKHPDVRELLDQLNQRRNAKTIKEQFVQQVLWGIFINYLTDERKYAINNPYYHIVDLEEGENFEDYIFRFFKEMSGGLTFAGTPAKENPYASKAAMIPEFIAFLLEQFDKGIMVPLRENREVKMKLLLKAESEEAFDKLRDFYLKIKGMSTFFDFKWRSLSTGEQSYLSMMSRFYHLKYHEHNALKHDLIILIDEGDAGYHPEWQRKFFKKTLEFLAELYTDHSIQLVFTANTPFLSSDLPKSHIVFIAKEKGKTPVIQSKVNTRAETFGANIHTLLSDSFYMQGVLIGDFAKKRIDDIIEYLNDEKQIEPNLSYKKTIDLIGEPILKKKLQSMWYEKFDLDEELSQLEKRIAEIKAQKRSKKR